MADTEEYFPRGGKKPTTTYFKQSANFLGAPEKGEKKKKKPKKKSEGDDGYLSDEGTKEIDQSYKNCAFGLSYKTIKEGLLVLGRVKNLFETKVVVSLPCRIIGSVMACHISEPYNKELEAYVNDKTDKVLDLTQMFRPGQYIAVKVLEVKDLSIMLSVMPQHVNAQTTIKDLQKGSLIQAAVSSVEDHGYVMDIGVPNTTAFLPKTNTNPEIELDVGMICWCSIKSPPAPGGGVVTLSNELVALQNSWLRHKTSGPMLPGSNLDFLVETPLDNGIEGHVFGDTEAYVQRQHADTVKGKKPSLGQKIRARLLYVMPTRNTPFLTMRSIFDATYPDLSTEQQLKDGQIIEEAQVLKITGRSIHFRLGGGCFGTMSLKRIQVDEDLSDEEVVAKSYPLGSKHKVRVLCYNLCDYVYSVTDQPEVVSEKYFNLEQLKSGDLVDATVKSVADNHVLLHVGRISGYVSQAHLFDSGILVDNKKSTTSKLPKKKFKVGQAVKARVLAVDPIKQTLFLTLKPSLLSPDLQVLDSYEKADSGKSYTGVIKAIKDYILVTFFNNVTAFIPKQFISKEPLQNIAQAFHIGQIVTCTILRVNAEDKKMSGSLITQPFTSTDKKEKPNKRKTTQDNEVSDYVYSVSDQPEVVSEKYFNLEQLKSGDLVDATVKSVADNHVLLHVGRISGYVSQAHLFDSGILVDNKKSTTSKLPKKKFKVGQAVKARVLAVDPIKQTLFLTLKPSLLSPDLQVLDSYEKADSGKSYTGVIKAIKDYILVTFFNNVTAFIPKQFISKEPLQNIAQAFHIGQIVTCTILRVNAEDKKMSGSLITQPFTSTDKKEKPNKRKTTQDNEVPNKKTKTELKEKKKKHSKEEPTEESDTEEKIDHDTKQKKKKSKHEQTDEVVEEPISKKDKKKKLKQNTEESNTEQDVKPMKDKKNKKRKAQEDTEEETEVVEESLETIDPQDALLIDMTECTTAKHCKKRVASLLKSINNRSKRIEKINRKIAKLEEKGLNSETKVFHTAMQTDRVIVEERLARLAEALEIAQSKMKEFGAEFSNQEYKKEKKTEEKKKEEKKTEVKKKEKLEVKVVESLEPALEAPSAQDFWSAGVNSVAQTVQEDEESSSEDEEKDQPKKKRKKLSVAEKLAKLREEEERVRDMERRATESEHQPRSSEQFERALLANPNCSQLWIAYMAFHLQATEVEKARKIGRKALTTISFQESLEKFNVWVALLSIECRFGTKESLQKTLEEALQMNEPFDIHSKLLDIYVETSKHQELVALVELMMRKYKRQTGVYGLCGAACFKLGLVDKARQVMQKAISVLEKKEHVPVLVQFALLESRSGSRERAEALFEQVLAVYPARVDICSAYVDMLLKNKDHDHVRQVMERMTSQKLPARKMKVLYKKWIEVEEKIGDQEQVDSIRQRAMEYIEKAKF